MKLHRDGVLVKSVPWRQRQRLVLVRVVDGSLEVDGDGAVPSDFGGKVHGLHGEHRVSAGESEAVEAGACKHNAHKSKLARHARYKQVLQFVLHALHRLLHQVHVLAAVAQRLLPARVEVNDPVHWQLARRKAAVPVAAA